MNKVVKRILIAFAVVLAIVYIAGIVYFSENTFLNTKVNGLDKSLISKSDVFKFDTDEYKLNVVGKDDKSVEIASKDIDLKKDVKGKPEVKQNVWLWPIEIFKSHDYEIDLDTKYNETKLDKILSESELFKKVIEPKDAYISTTENAVTLEEEVLGNKLDKEKLIASIKSSIEKEEEKLQLKKEYVLPKITKEDENLKAQFEKLSKIFKNKFVFDFEDRKYELTGQKLLEMYNVDSKGVYVLNRQSLRDFIRDIAIETDTYNTPHKFKATGIGEITVPGGIYGWQMNVDKTTDNVMAMLENNKTGNVEIVYLHEAKHRGLDDIGDTYIEIDLSRQHMWFYKDGKLYLDTDIISGDLRNRDATTPVGVNKVWSKETDRKLNGNNAVTGSRYSYPVKYWMPVGWTGSGIHDTWHRTEYGGNVYKTNGSSSCINTPPKAMEKLFPAVPLYTAVVIYESSTNNSPTEFERQEQIRRGEAKMDVQ